MQGFYWLVNGVLAGARQPGGMDPSDHACLDADLDWMQAQGIRAILSLTEDPLPEMALARGGFAWRHIPIVDMTAPNRDQIAEALAFIDAQAAVGSPVAVHCLAGQGRTGTILAAYLIRLGMTSDRAISELRIVCPRAVENEAQELALTEYALMKSWLM